MSGTLDGFKTSVRKGIQVRVGDVITMDLALDAGGVAEVIEVVAATPVLDTTPASPGR